jgi:Hemerythrin HHE cation binding domain
MPTAKLPRSSDALSLLVRDHERVGELLGQLERMTTPREATAEALLEAVRAELRIHAAIEQEILCPAFRAAGRRRDDAALCHDAIEEHRVLELLLPGLDARQAGSPEFAARIRALRGFFRRHADAQEREMFRRLRALIARDELGRLGQRMLARRSELAPPGG